MDKRRKEVKIWKWDFTVWIFMTLKCVKKSFTGFVEILMRIKNCGLGILVKKFMKKLRGKILIYRVVCPLTWKA